MTGPDGRPVYLDTTVLSNFAVTDSVGLLADLFEAPRTTPTVVDELERGHESGYEFLGTALALIAPHEAADTEAVPVIEPPPQTTEVGAAIRDRLDSGEASVLRCARVKDGVVTTDDSDARSVAADLDVDVVGSLGVLARAVNDDELSEATADDWLDSWGEFGYFSPVDSVGKVLDDGE